MDKFWKWSKASTESPELIIDGAIASDSWFEDEITPKMFREELAQYPGDITVRVTSPGGDVSAGVAIYNYLNEHNGQVVVKIDGIAASIASLIAMAGDRIVMLPGSMMMVHQPWTLAAGNSDELAQVVEMLEKTCESMIPIYAARTGLSEERISELLKAETWMTADDAVELGFADEAVPAKAGVSSAIKNAINYASAVQKAVMQPAMSIKARKAAKEEVVTEKSEAPITEAEVEKTEEAETPEVVETEVEENNQSTKEENIVNEQEKIAQAQIIEPKNQAPVETPSAKNYLETKASIEDFAEVLRANAGKSLADVKAAWGDALKTKAGLTNTDYFQLPTPLITKIEDAVKASGIYNALNHTGLDVFRVVWDKTDSEADTSRAGGHKKGTKKDDQVLDFEDRVIRAQYVYKYLVLDKETVRENQSTGALIRFVLNELPTRIIREIERAVVVGDGRAAGHKRKISKFTSIKSDVAANNIFASSYAPASGETRYESIVKALDQIEAEGSVYIISKKGYLSDLRLEKDANGHFIWAPGTDIASALGFAGHFEPTWFKDAVDSDYDAYIAVLGSYNTVGDNSIESFTNFKLESNENEYLQEVYKGGALAGIKAAVGIKKAASAPTP